MQGIDFNKFPNFLIVGSNKGGTTSLYQYCNQHPEILMSSIKEPMFFTSQYSKSNDANKDKDPDRKTLAQRLSQPRYVTSIKEYQELFVGKPNATARGEASTAYLGGYRVVIPKVKIMYPSMKIIASLRHPIERAFSAHSMYYDAGVEKRSFEECVFSEIENRKKRIFEGRQYLLQGLYYQPISNYIQAFGNNKVLVILFDDLKKDSKESIQKIFNFLEVDETFTPDTAKKFNTAKQRSKGEELTQNSIGEEAWNACVDFFKEDVRKLQELVDFKDVHWKALM